VVIALVVGSSCKSEAVHLGVLSSRRAHGQTLQAMPIRLDSVPEGERHRPRSS